jgi:hypothetical protein
MTRNKSEWTPVRGRVLRGILFEISSDNTKVRIRHGELVEVIKLPDKAPRVVESLTERKPDVK